ncbi:succinylglutamate desuccinylase [Propionivibrio dicarboxylicus]|uniref:succinylglutamate desuccinylase n=1 Tax=Propionivibrio dicarboxylicus TaxID=83767 RepID=UPI003CCBAD24
MNALTHGNEICGAWAVDALLREAVRPVRGKLSLSFANVGAFASFDPAHPEASRWIDEDFNRLWDVSTLDGPRQSAELTRARALRGFFATVDYLLDLHSMHTPGPAMGLSGPTRGGLDFAHRLGLPGYVVIDAGHSAGRRLRDFADFSDEASPRQGYLVECGFHFERASVEVAHQVSRRFLDLTGVCPGLAVSVVTAPQMTVRITDAITIRSDAFRFAETIDSMQVIAKAGTLIALDGNEEVRTPYDDCVIVMPAPERYMLAGMTAVRLGRRVD